MIDSEVIPYQRFLECRERRQRIVAQLAAPGRPPTIDVEVLSDAVVMPVPNHLPLAKRGSYDPSSV